MELTANGSQEHLHRYPILKILEDLEVSYRCFEHPPVFTVEEGKELLKDIPGQGTKNLFVRDAKKTRYALYTVREEIRVDLKSLGEAIGFGKGKISFASPEDLRNKLCVEPGSVTALALSSPDADPCVEFYFDKALMNSEYIQVHPMINTATVVLNPRLLCYDLLEKNGRVVKLL